MSLDNFLRTSLHMSPRYLLSSPLRRLAPSLRHPGFSSRSLHCAAAAPSRTNRFPRCSSIRTGTAPIRRTIYLSAATTAPSSRAMSTTALPRLPILEAISGHDPASTAVVHCASGRKFRYGELLGDVSRARDRLREAAGGRELAGERVAFLVENSYDYVGKRILLQSFPLGGGREIPSTPLI